MEGASDDLRNAIGAIDLLDRFRDLAEEMPGVDLLKGFAPAHPPSDLAEKEDHRRRILPADMQAGRGIGGARTARRHDDARPAGELAPGFCRHRGAAFLAADGDR